MKILRSVLSTVGSPGGMTWSIFGILAASFNITGTIAFALGSILGVGYLVCAPVVFAVTYSDINDKEEKLKRKLYENTLFLRNKLGEFLFLLKKVQSEALKKNILEKKLSKLKKLGAPEEALALLSALSNMKDLVLFEKQPSEKQRLMLSEFLLEYGRKELLPRQPPLPWFEYPKTMVPGFLAGFGSIAGGSAGMLGLLNGMGICAGFASMPAVGVLVVITACIVSTYIALKLLSYKKEDDEKKYFYHYYQEVIPQLGDVNFVLREILQRKESIQKLSKTTPESTFLSFKKELKQSYAHNANLIFARYTRPEFQKPVAPKAAICSLF